MDTQPFEIVLIVDANGDYAIGQDRDQAAEKYEEDIGQISEAEAVRYVKVIVNIPLPSIAVLEGTAPAEGKAELTVKE